jgi:poly(A) polymerase
VALVDAVPPAQQSSAGEPSFERRIVRLAALLRPLGGRRARERLQGLRSSNDDTADIVTLIDLAQPLLARLANSSEPAWSDASVRRHVRDTGRLRAALHALVRAEVAVHVQPLAGTLARGLDALEAHIAALGDREPLDDLGPQLDGAAVMAVLGIGPGRAVGEALAHLAEVRLDDGLLADGQIQTRLIEWWRHHQEQ